MPIRSGKPKNEKAPALTETYRHPTAESLLRPDVGTQAQFKKKKAPQKYRYDSSLSPVLEFDGQNPAREMGEWLLGLIETAASLPSPQTFSQPEEFKNSAGNVVATVRGLQDAVDQLKGLGKPFLNWAGKAQRLSFDVPTLPLFVHERLSTKATLETLNGHKRERQMSMFELFGDPERPMYE
jgi:adenine-specific DNA-methyltransferase